MFKCEKPTKDGLVSFPFQNVGKKVQWQIIFPVCVPDKKTHHKLGHTLLNQIWGSRLHCYPFFLEGCFFLLQKLVQGRVLGVKIYVKVNRAGILGGVLCQHRHRAKHRHLGLQEPDLLLGGK